MDFIIVQNDPLFIHNNKWNMQYNGEFCSNIRCTFYSFSYSFSLCMRICEEIEVVQILFPVKQIPLTMQSIFY